MLRIKNSPPQRRAILGTHAAAVATVLVVVTEAFSRAGHDAELTSGVDGKHSATSLHYAGAAWDFRLSGVPESDRGGITASVASRLGTDFDVIYEGAGTSTPHLHVEWQPREP